MFDLIIRTRDKYTPTIVNRKKNIKIHAFKKNLGILNYRMNVTVLLKSKENLYRQKKAVNV